MDYQCTLLSSLEEQNTAFNWTIENWNLIANTLGKFKPKPFTLVDSSVKCSVILNFSDWKISVSIDINRPSTALLRSRTSMVLVWEEDSKEKSYRILDEDNVTEEELSGRYIYNYKLPEKQEVNEYIGPNDSLTFHITINCYWDRSVVRYNLHTDEKKIKIISDNLENENCLYRKKLTLKNYGPLHEKNQICDVTIKTAEGELKAHRVILAIASPYFLAMFSKNLKESTESIVDLTKDTDVTLEIYEGFLDYVYGLKTVEDLKSIIMELLVLADKYVMQELKKACEQYLCDNLDKNNVAKLLYFSHKYNCKHLLQQALDLAKNNIDTIKESNEFEDIYRNKDLMLLLL